VSLKVIRWDNWEATPPRPRRRNTRANKERADQARPRRHRHGINLVRNAERLRLAHHIANQHWHPAMMLPRCNLGDYTTGRGVQIALARNSFNEHLATFAHQGDRRLIAA
jgi:hypothetical protein